MHGALGYSTDTPLAHMYQHARWARFADGADEVHQMRIAQRTIAAYTRHRQHPAGHRRPAPLIVELLTAEASEDLQRRAAGGLACRGIGVGERVAFLTTSSGTMLSAVLGALRVGVVPVPLNPALLAEERDLVLGDAEPALVVNDAVLAELMAGPLVDLRRCRSPGRCTSPAAPPAARRGCGPGCSTRPRRALVDEERELWGFAADDVNLVCSPLYHSAPLRFATGTLLAGGRIVVPGRLRSGRGHGGDRGRAADHDVLRADAPPAALRGTGTGPGSRTCRRSGWSRTPAHLPAREGRLSRCSPRARRGSSTARPRASSPPARSDEWLARPGTVGRARRAAPSRSTTTARSGATCPGTPGSATGATRRRRPRPGAATPSPSATSAGSTTTATSTWTAAATTWSSPAGVNVYPVEVEHVLVEAPGVREVAVFGVADERWGQRVCAAVVGDVSPAQVIEHARAHLAAYKCPKDVFVVDELPHTSTGKLQRLALVQTLGLASDVASD